MLVGVIDLGSNTIRLSIYKCTKDKFTLLLNEKSFAGLAGYAQNGRLSPAGITLACDTINKYKKICRNLNVLRLYVFATASLRNVSNTEEVSREIKAQTDIVPDVLSGEEEARFGYAGAMRSVKLLAGLYVDIGGGSTELAYFRDGKVLYEASLGIGCLNLYLNEIDGLLPVKEERARIRSIVSAELDNLDWLKSVQVKEICGVGGTIRALKKFSYDITGVNGGSPLDVSFLDYLVNTVGDPRGTGYRQFLRVVPDRVHTLIPGMLILDEIIARVNTQLIHVSKYGVREGYLISRVLTGEYDV